MYFMLSITVLQKVLSVQTVFKQCFKRTTSELRTHVSFKDFIFSF